MVVTFMCARGPAPHVARGRKTLQMHGFLYKHMGKLQRAITLILRRESKFFQVKSLVSTHSACPCKNYPPKCSQTPHELIRLFNYLFNEPLTISPVAAQCNGACGKRSSVECVHIDRCWPQKSWRWRLRSTLNLDSDKFRCFNHRDELDNTVFLPNFRLVTLSCSRARASPLWQ